MTQTAPEPVAELWTYGGLRVGKDGRRLYAWLDPGGEELLFSRTGRMAVGSQYTVRVTRDGTVTMHGTPEYAGSAADEATRAPCGPRTPWRRPGWRPSVPNAAPPAATPWMRPSPRCWNWPPRCAPPPGGTPWPPT